MKVLLIVVLIFSFHQSFAQDTVHLQKVNDSTAISIQRPPQAIYFGLGGSGLLFSFNYDTRFKKTVNGFGTTVGIGFWSTSNLNVLTVPVSINYLAGSKDNFLELAAGATYAHIQTDDGSRFTFTENSTEQFTDGIIEHITAGYRYQHTGGGFMGRIGIAPLFYKAEYATSFYLDIGYTF